jgi:hypothetical protein
MFYIYGYILIYLLAIIFGWIVESFAMKSLYRPTIKNTIISPHSIALVIITFIYQVYISKYLVFDNPRSIFILLIICISFVGLYECIMGQVSYQYHGRQNWNYQKYTKYTCCDGYISIYSVMFFALMLFLYFIFIYPIIFE